MKDPDWYVRPWTKQKELKERYRDEEVPDITELAEMLKAISWGKIEIDFQTLRAQALIAMYYLTGCRATEILRCPELRKQAIKKRVVYGKYGEKKILYETDEFGDILLDKWKEKHAYEGIRKKDISFKKIDGRLCMLIRTENRKNKDRKTKRQPIPIDREKKLAVFVYRFLKRVNDDDFLFPFSKDRAETIINTTIGFNIHFLRHIRATHLITKYDFNEQMLVRFMGWTDSRPAKTYMELKHSDLFRQFYKVDNV